jgi:hypothetical protein
LMGPSILPPSSTNDSRHMTKIKIKSLMQRNGPDFGSEFWILCKKG